MSTQTKLAAAGQPLRAEEPATPQNKTQQGKTGPLASVDSELLKDVQISLETHLGGAELSVQELLDLKSGSVVKLDLRLNEPVELRLRGAVVARGEIVAVGDHFGVRIIEIGKVK